MKYIFFIFLFLFGSITTRPNLPDKPLAPSSQAHWQKRARLAGVSPTIGFENPGPFLSPRVPECTYTSKPSHLECKYIIYFAKP
jgi:hypothetical protein